MSNSKAFVHSGQAISIIHRFYNKKFMVYVEGPDDIPFWDDKFSSEISSSVNCQRKVNSFAIEK